MKNRVGLQKKFEKNFFEVLWPLFVYTFFILSSENPQKNFSGAFGAGPPFPPHFPFLPPQILYVILRDLRDLRDFPRGPKYVILREITWSRKSRMDGKPCN